MCIVRRLRGASYAKGWRTRVAVAAGTATAVDSYDELRRATRTRLETVEKMVMKNETHLVTELGRLNVRINAPVTAGIWLAVGDKGFPMIGWNDFIVVVLGWWAAAILRLMRNTTGTERVPFMDGPYAVEVSATASGRLHFRMFAGPSGGREVATSETEFERFVGELSAQARRLLDECKLHGWWSADADELALCLQDLNEELSDRNTGTIDTGIN